MCGSPTTSYSSSTATTCCEPSNVSTTDLSARSEPRYPPHRRQTTDQPVKDQPNTIRQPSTKARQGRVSDLTQLIVAIADERSTDRSGASRRDAVVGDGRSGSRRGVLRGRAPRPRSTKATRRSTRRRSATTPRWHGSSSLAVRTSGRETGAVPNRSTRRRWVGPEPRTGTRHNSERSSFPSSRRAPTPTRRLPAV